MRVLIGFAILFMAKFYAHELTLGQTNILLATLIVAGLLAVQVDEPHLGAGLFALAAFVKPYALILLPWLAVSAGFGPALTGLGVLGLGLAAPALPSRLAGQRRAAGGGAKPSATRPRRTCWAPTTSRSPRCGRNGSVSARSPTR